MIKKRISLIIKKIIPFINKCLIVDKYLLSFIILLSILSFLPIYSSTSNLIDQNGDTNIPFYYLMRHSFLISIGFLILFLMQIIKYKYFYIISIVSIPIVSIMLLITLIQGNISHGFLAARWLHIPFIQFSFQTAYLANIVLFTYCTGFLSKKRNEKIRFRDTIVTLLLPIFSIIGLIFPSNGSTAIIMFISVLMLLFIGGYPITHIFGIFFIGIMLMSTYIFIAIKLDNHHPVHRVFTWKYRIENFYSKSKKNNYQITQAKKAIVIGQMFGKGPGKSIIKYCLPQSSSDFIYAIIIEEYGLFGGIVLLFIYFMILYRIIVIATKVKHYFCSLLVLAMGLPLMNQVIINIFIATGLLPIAGQPLPIISMGGTYIWATFVNFGMILNISRMVYDKVKTIK